MHSHVQTDDDVDGQKLEEADLNELEQVANVSQSPAEAASTNPIAKPVTSTTKLSSFSKFTQRGSAQACLLRTLTFASELSAVQVLRLSTDLIDFETTTIDGSHDANHRNSSSGVHVVVNAQSELPVSVTNPSDAVSATLLPPTLQLHMDNLFEDLHLSLLDLTQIVSHATVIAVLRDSMEAFFLCHRKISGSSTVRSRSLVHQNSMPASPVDSSHPSVSDSPRERFVAFIEAHQRLLNLLISKAESSLATGPFAILIQFPHVLQFSVKEKFFRQRIKSLAHGLRHHRTSIRIHRYDILSLFFRYS
jgi:hypothetical protein